MRLVNYDVGEIADRLSILALKRLHKGDEANGGWKTEQSALQAQLAGRKLNGSWTVLTLELAAVNSAIWHAEDDLRALRCAFESTSSSTSEQARYEEFNRVTLVAFNIQELNDRRAEIITALNTQQGSPNKEKG